MADRLVDQLDAILAAVGTEAPVGARRTAERLAARLGRDVQARDVDDLAEAGHLTVAGRYKEWALFDAREADALGEALVVEVVDAREAAYAASIGGREAAEHLGWTLAEWDKVKADRGIAPDRYGRYPRALVDALAADEELAEALRQDRLVMADDAATYLEIRPTDLRYVLAAGWLAPRRHHVKQVTPYTTVQVPLYRVGDLDDVRARPDVDWEAVRAVRPGEPSRLRRYARRPVNRAAVIRRWVAELGDRYGIEAWAWWHPAGWWEVDWERADGAPTRSEVATLVADHRVLRDYPERLIVLSTEAGAAVRWARAMREPGAAVIVDTETTDLDGYVVEIAAIEAATGETLLDTLVCPGTPISEGAYWVHGISDEQVAAAPPWGEVLPQLLDVTRDRVVLAYNAPFDQAVVARHSRRDGLELGHLAERRRWACLMTRRSDYELCQRWLPLGGGHRALGDCRRAYEQLCRMTAPPRQPRRARR